MAKRISAAERLRRDENRTGGGVSAITGATTTKPDPAPAEPNQPRTAPAKRPDSRAKEIRQVSCYLERGAWTELTVEAAGTDANAATIVAALVDRWRTLPAGERAAVLTEAETIAKERRQTS